MPIITTISFLQLNLRKYLLEAVPTFSWYPKIMSYVKFIQIMLFNNATWYLEVCYSAGSRPRDRGGRGGVSKKVFGWSKNKVGGVGPGLLGPSPGSATSYGDIFCEPRPD